MTNVMPKIDEIKACPFCGGLPEITKHYKDDMFKLRHWCPIVGTLDFDWKNNRDQVITTWNTRKEPIECNSIPNKPPKKLG